MLSDNIPGEQQAHWIGKTDQRLEQVVVIPPYAEVRFRQKPADRTNTAEACFSHLAGACLSRTLIAMPG